MHRFKPDQTTAANSSSKQQQQTNSQQPTARYQPAAAATIAAEQSSHAVPEQAMQAGQAVPWKKKKWKFAHSDHAATETVAFKPARCMTGKNA